MKKILQMIALCVIMFTITVVSASAMLIEYDNKRVDYTGAVYNLVINGQAVDTSAMPPIIFNDRALVPLREVFEALNAKVDYNDSTKGISVEYGNIKLQLAIDSNTAKLNGIDVSIPDGVTPKLIAKAGEKSAKTMVPVRFISETIGMQVDFSEKTGTISITSPDNTAVAPTPIPAATPDTSIPESISSLGSVEAYMDGEDTILDISSSDGFSGYTSELLSDPTRVVIYADNVAARSAMLSCEINKGNIKFLRIAYADGRSTIVLDTYDKIGGYDITVNDKIMSVRIKPYNGAANGEKPMITPPPAAVIAPSASGEKIIVIDPGHGGTDPGTSGSLGGTVYDEKNINLAVSLKVVNILRNSGYNVQMTREGDTYPTLEERSAFANSLNAALFVSIHSNSYEQSSANGTEIYYSKDNNGSAYGITSEKVAEYVLNAMMAQMDTRNRGVKTANHVVTRTSNMPAVLVELGFMTNQSDMSKLADENYQNLIAQGIANGIIQSVNLINVPQ